MTLTENYEAKFIVCQRAIGKIVQAYSLCHNLNFGWCPKGKLVPIISSFVFTVF